MHSTALSMKIGFRISCSGNDVLLLLSSSFLFFLLLMFNSQQFGIEWDCQLHKPVFKIVSKTFLCVFFPSVQISICVSWWCHSSRPYWISNLTGNFLNKIFTLRSFWSNTITCMNFSNLLYPLGELWNFKLFLVYRFCILRCCHIVFVEH